MATATAAADTSSRSAAVLWIRDRWEDWLELDQKFPELMHRAAVARGASTDEEARATAAESIERLGKLWQFHAYVTERVRATAGLLPSGLGSLVWPAAAIALAVSIAWVITHYDAELRIVQLLEDGELSADQARELLEEADGRPSLFSAGRLASLPILAAAGFGLWWVVFRRAP